MLDLAHWCGNDLNVAASGDLLAVDEPIRTEQRLVRRLLTVPGSYFWEPTYGAGLAQYIGKPTAARAITAVIQAQLRRESAVARSPQPTVAVSQGQNGALLVTVMYWNNNTGTPRTLSFPVG